MIYVQRCCLFLHITLCLVQLFSIILKKKNSPDVIRLDGSSQIFKIVSFYLSIKLDARQAMCVHFPQEALWFSNDLIKRASLIYIYERGASWLFLSVLIALLRYCKKTIKAAFH